MAAPAGSIVSLYMDTKRTISVDDEILTRSGRRYVVVAVRQQKRGLHTGRWHLQCEVLPRGVTRIQWDDDDTKVHYLRWYSRG